MKTKFATSGSENDSDPSSIQSPTLKYLQQKSTQPSFRKASGEETDRLNFCFNMSGNSYTVMRSYEPGHGVQTLLYYTKFNPNNKLGQVCIVHGYGESSDDYLEMGQYLATRGNVVHMIDLRGFGYSGGSRVNQPIEHLFADIQTLLKKFCQRNLATFIVAQGLGALFVQYLLQENSELPLAGVVTISPLLTFRKFTHSSNIQKLLHKISPWIVGNLLVHNMINPTAICKKPSAIKAKIYSVFFQSFITLNMANMYQQVGKKVRSQAYKFGYPLLLCYGLKDMIQDPKQVEDHFNRISSQDKQLLAFHEGYHDLHKDYEADELFRKIGHWIESRRNNKIKWKNIGSLQKGSYLRWRQFWTKAAKIVALLVLVIGFILKRRR